MISIVDDDASIRDAMKGLLRSIRLDAEAFSSAEEFLIYGRLNETECLILDLNLPGMNGLELQNRLHNAHCDIPIVFITAHADDVSRQRALQAGAIEFLSKPVRRATLFKAIESAIHSGNNRSTEHDVGQL